jgi:hypothetical protein
MEMALGGWSAQARPAAVFDSLVKRGVCPFLPLVEAA